MPLKLANPPPDAAADPAPRSPAGRPTRRRRPLPLLLRRRTAAKLCSVGLATFDRWTSAGYNPAPIRVGGGVFWAADELRAWVRAGCPRREEWSARWAATNKAR